MTKTELERQVEASKLLRPGGDHYRAYVGPPAQFDFMGATQFTLLFGLGLREEHTLLDVGCGSLRAGRLFLQYLLPDRYVGVDPNSWLRRAALSSEIGEDIARLKTPLFFEDDTFSFVEIGRQFNFVVFQSVLSHTGGDIFNRPLEQAGKVLKPGGQVLFTVLDESTPGFENQLRGDESPGWHYPACVTYRQSEVIQRCARFGLHVQKLDWFHPRQTWYRAVAESGDLLSKAELVQLGTGRPLFDDRFM